MSQPPLHILLAAPRGFCAGVVRAIDVVERALEIYGAPVYVRHEIVHNRYVVDALRARGAIFIDELDEAPQGAAPVIFSAHGVPKSVVEDAANRNLVAIDATARASVARGISDAHVLPGRARSDGNSQASVNQHRACARYILGAVGFCA